MSRFEAVAFDFDGTLADAVPQHYQARLGALEEMYRETGDERYANIPTELQYEAHKHGSSPITIIGWVLQQRGIVTFDADLTTDPIVRAVVEKKNANYDALVSKGAEEVPGAVRMIRRAAVRLPGRLAIVTTARKQQEVMPFLRRHGISTYFRDDRIITREDVPPELMKPHPAAYELALSRVALSTRPKRVAAIEDSPQGIEAAKAAGLTVFGIATTHTVDEIKAFPNHQQPDEIVDNHDHLAQYIL